MIKNNERINAAKLNFPLIKPGKSGVCGTFELQIALMLIHASNLKCFTIVFVGDWKKN
jgi:hypothetical protein